MICMFCDEDVPPDERTSHPIYDIDGLPNYPHWYCALREVLGGIGHHEDHGFWCQTMHETDAGLSKRESARRVGEWVKEHGVQLDD